ncbi:TIGR00725 family protein [Phorcysia thermohydrogeniphila]|uniref:TIGR00725 family protein n=1 Tax=Phorcysia thermohydrogeniphila TaxID=936138 RepID=A0A4R1GFE1_9BACT|nr:TIGR00725 family protein [Phorcysia thermohydrogeniphila]TCK04529.1 hypothetical protein CLV27_0961 [Phorcysia thermohydrogeniphila]
METVSVIGDGNVLSSSELYQTAVEVGRIIAEKGYVLVCGGLYGVMEGAAKGAKEAGGITVGILPEYSSVANPYIDIEIPTGMGQARNVLVVSSSEVVVALGGNYGTLSEIAHALKLGKRVLGYKTWKIEGIDYYEDREGFISTLLRSL